MRPTTVTDDDITFFTLQQQAKPTPRQPNRPRAADFRLAEKMNFHAHRRQFVLYATFKAEGEMRYHRRR
jgi:hypothetical protein